MTNNIGCIGTGKQFKLGGTTYVRIPEMILQCAGTGFVVNSITVEEQSEITVSPKILAVYFLHGTIVEMVNQRGETKNDPQMLV